MKKLKSKITLFLFFWAMLLLSCQTGQFNRNPAIPVNRLPQIDPDYSGIVIPPNIAPLNFVIREAGATWFVKISAQTGKPIEITSDDSLIQIPLKAWQTLLAQNHGQPLGIQIYVKNRQGEIWQYQKIVNQIAEEKIDPYLVYRLLRPGYIIWKEMGIYQRCVENFDEKTILHNRALDKACVNCHTFYQNSPTMLLHLRGGPGTGMLLATGDSIVKISTQTSFNRHTAYACWHPNGKIIAFSANKIHQFFHGAGENRDVFDSESDLVLYLLESNLITTSPEIARPDRMETYPAWSPDGQYLYFCSAPQFETGVHFSQQYRNIKYDLQRIAYDADQNSWGQVETLLSAAGTGLSVAHPKISPDGRWLLFCMASYGNFTIYRPDSDLYLMDLTTGKYFCLEGNSDRSESYHSWASNSRWFVFSSKRRDGVCARPYFCHVSENGDISKPVLLPQEDPTFYTHFMKTYNLPELINQPVTVRPQSFIKAAYEKEGLIQARLDSQITVQREKDITDFPWQPAGN